MDIKQEITELIRNKKYCPENGCALTVDQVNSCDHCMASMIDILYKANYYDVELQHQQEIEQVKQDSFREGVYHRDYLENDPWYWIGDGNDNLDSLCCPILINADQFRKEILKATVTGGEVGFLLSIFCLLPLLTQHTMDWNKLYEQVNKDVIREV